MRRTIPLIMAAATVLLVFAGTAGHGMNVHAASTPDAAVQAMYNHVKSHDFDGAFVYVAKQSQTDATSFTRDLNGKDSSLRTLSALQKVDTRILNESGDSANVRATTEWSSAVGALYDTRDLKVVKEDGAWKVVWPKDQRQNLPPQVIPVNFLRWDIIHRSGEDDWGAQNVEAPRMRIVSMNAVEKDGGITVLGELVNEDTVPGFASVGATLIGKDGRTLAEESSFDKISHTLLPKEVSPFRIDFPGYKLAQVKSVRMNPNYLLVPASADPVIGVLHQRLDTDSRGRPVLRGELLNESGQPVNIPHVLATFYDDSGKVVWVADGYVDHALQPQEPEPFAVALRDDLANVHRFRVTVNQYSIDRRVD
jgi:hypothetical protein